MIQLHKNSFKSHTLKQLENFTIEQHIYIYLSTYIYIYIYLYIYIQIQIQNFNYCDLISLNFLKISARTYVSTQSTKLVIFYLI